MSLDSVNSRFVRSNKVQILHYFTSFTYMQSKYFSGCFLPAFVYKYLDFLLLVRDFTYYK